MIPLLLMGAGAAVGVAAYVGYHAIRHYGFNDRWDLSWRGALASASVGALAPIPYAPAIVQLGAGLGLAAYSGYHLVKRYVLHKSWDASPEGAVTSAASGAVLLPTIMLGVLVLPFTEGGSIASLAIFGSSAGASVVVGHEVDVKPAPAPASSPAPVVPTVVVAAQPLDRAITPSISKTPGMTNVFGSIGDASRNP